MSEANSTMLSGVRQIPLTQGKVALVDEEDYERVNQFKWYARQTRSIWHARRSVCNTRPFVVYLHRFILDAPFNKEVDHINGDGLDNRRVNLRLCTHAENLRNTRKFRGTSLLKGSSWHSSHNKWRATIRASGRHVHLGYFDTEEEAHAAYCAASAKFHGEFGRTA